MLIPWITDTIKTSFPHARSVMDLFSGTSRVGLGLKKLGYSVLSNDHNLFAYHIARCYIETSPSDLPNNFPSLIKHLNELPAKPGFFTENYCLKARFFHPRNGERIDTIRTAIDQLDIKDHIRSVLLVSLMEAADRVDSTCGIQMAYLKKWAARAHQALELRIPVLVEQAPGGHSKAYCLEAQQAAALPCDVAYLDPPYNQHSYRGNYHIWETLVLNDQPDLYGTALKRRDCQTVKSSFNSKRCFNQSLLGVLRNLSTKNIVLSFSDEGFINKEEIENLLSHFGTVTTLDIDYKRYVGAQIGIYNHNGKKVGKIKKLRNKEYLYIVNKNSHVD